MNYCIVDISDLDNIVWDQVVENKETIRYNVARNKFLVKYESAQPSFLKSYSPYTHEEILNILNLTVGLLVQKIGNKKS
jgi:hypothetical protein